MIILNDYEYAKDMIESRSLGRKPFDTFTRVARYYADIKGYTKRQVRKVMDEFLLRCDPVASLPKWSDTIDNAVNRAFRTKAVEIESIPITIEEMEKIDSLGGRQTRRLAFTLLCLSKYWDIVNPNGDHWCNTPDRDIMRMANINTSIKRQSMMYHTLNEIGMIQFSKKIDNTNVRVLFGCPDGETVLNITDFRNLGYQYLMYHGEPYFTCESCGITTKIKQGSGAGRKKKYCADCANRIKIQQNINSVMRGRAI